MRSKSYCRPGPAHRSGRRPQTGVRTNFPSLAVRVGTPPPGNLLRDWNVSYADTPQGRGPDKRVQSEFPDLVHRRLSLLGPAPIILRRLRADNPSSPPDRVSRFVLSPRPSETRRFRYSVLTPRQSATVVQGDGTPGVSGTSVSNELLIKSAYTPSPREEWGEIPSGEEKCDLISVLPKPSPPVYPLPVSTGSQSKSRHSLGEVGTKDPLGVPGTHRQARRVWTGTTS